MVKYEIWVKSVAGVFDSRCVVVCVGTISHCLVSCECGLVFPQHAGHRVNENWTSFVSVDTQPCTVGLARIG